MGAQAACRGPLRLPRDACDVIKIAGGLRPNPDQWWSGGLWVMEVATRRQAESLCENDPYFKLGLRKAYRLYVWGKAPFYGPVTL